MLKALLILGAIVDVALAALLIGVSGFLFGSGPESMHGGAGFAIGYGAAVLACLAAPIVGFFFQRAGSVVAGVIVGWVPPFGALLALAIPAPY